jgi:hypothetical protein
VEGECDHLPLFKEIKTTGNGDVILAEEISRMSLLPIGIIHTPYQSGIL